MYTSSELSKPPSPPLNLNSLSSSPQLTGINGRQNSPRNGQWKATEARIPSEESPLVKYFFSKKLFLGESNNDLKHRRYSPDEIVPNLLKRGSMEDWAPVHLAVLNDDDVQLSGLTWFLFLTSKLD